MFTGIVQSTGRVHSMERSGRAASLVLDGKNLTTKLRAGDSVAINGACLSVVAKRKSLFEVQAVEETMKKTNLGTLKVGDRVNFELPLRASDRFGGHIVLGHVDSIGKIVSIKQLRKSWMFRIKIPRKFLRYLVPTGSIAVDGVSLTVAQLDGSTIGIAVIPQTMVKTNFTFRRTGDAVNLEFDVLGKYIDRLLRRPRRRRA